MTKEEDDEVTDGYDPIESDKSIASMMSYSYLVMSSYVDCGMHLVFHGMIAYCMEVMEEFITD